MKVLHGSRHYRHYADLFRDELVRWFEQGSKPVGSFRIGIEHEKFPFYRDRLTPFLTRANPADAAAFALCSKVCVTARAGSRSKKPDGRSACPTTMSGGLSRSNPAASSELSGAPLRTLHEASAELAEHLENLKAVAEPLGIGFLGLGGSPKWSLADTPVMPKERYRIMAAYMPKVGTRGLDMMFRTCTVQANLDYARRADMVRKLRVSLALQPIVTALFANSPFTEGRPNGFLSWRSHVWLDTDNARAGMMALRSNPAWDSNATSITRSTFRCISSSGGRVITTSPA